MRLAQLDILRGIAILLVLGKHIDKSPLDLPVPFSTFFFKWHEVGWMGVDLFFVLSGFLVSGLLFNETKIHGSIRFRRFFVRRGFKIYPAFYTMLAATLIIEACHDRVDWHGLIDEALFIQNYGPNVWNHTWSLAVEEHFYLLLPLLLVLLGRSSGEKRDPYALLVKICVLVILISPLLRFVTSLSLPYSFKTNLAPTHLRLDGLFIGVLISYCFHFRPMLWSALCRISAWKMVALASFLLAPCFFLGREKYFFMHTLGISLIDLGFGVILILTLHPGLRSIRWNHPFFKAPGAVFIWLGVYSYSIYLWHMPVLRWGATVFNRLRIYELTTLHQFAVILMACVTVGWMMANLIEVPCLRLRNRLFPSRGTALSIPSPVREGQPRSGA